MEFEFDKAKSTANKKKHGIDFVQGQLLWADANRLEIPLRYELEKRYAVVAKINGKFWTAIATEPNNIIRIISIRRSREPEYFQYEEET
ncbi:MAG: BrnT family toxin [Alphaproteobacteria bacterium]|nr:BrnT family toxin [Alphaproteobacteria bacterium]